MTFDELLKTEKIKTSRKKPADEEHRIQVSCVKWFREKYPKFSSILFAIPNGGRRDAVTGKKLKEEGATAGVADLILLKGNGLYGALCIEMKKPGRYQSPEQKAWQKKVEAIGNKYIVCRSLNEFVRVINDYLKDV